MFLALIAGLALIALAAALVARAIALPWVRAGRRLEHIGSYGFDAAAPEAERPGQVSGGLQRIAKAVGNVAAGRLRGIREEDLRRELLAAGMYGMTPVTLIGYRVLGAMVLPLAALWYASSAGAGGPLVVLLLPLALAGGWVAPLTLVRRRGRHRLSRIDDDLPELVDILVVTIEAGMSFSASLQIAAERFTGPLGDELRLVLQEQSLGLPTDQALANLLDRAGTDGVRSFVRAVRQGESLGVSIGQIMRNLATDMRKRRQARAEERAQKAPIKILFPLVALIFPSLFVVLLGPALLSLLSALGGGA